jgi:hypothetical protein
MQTRKSVLSTILSLFLASNVLGQKATPAAAAPDGGKTIEEKLEKRALEKKAVALIDEVLKEAANLRLPENRIRLQAGAADLLWKHDEKRARDLFKLALASLRDLIAEMSAPQSSRRIDRTSDYPIRMQLGTELRREIIQMIAQRDPRLARDLLRESRQSAPTGERNRENGEQERHLELELASQVANTDPSQALQIAEESLDNGPIQEELPGIIQQLATKDRDGAAKLVSALMKRLRSANLLTDRPACSVAVALVRLATNREEDDSESGEKRSSNSTPIQILDERTLRELVDIIAAGALASLPIDPGSLSAERQHYGLLLVAEIQTLMPEIEKYAPARAAALKKKLIEAGGSLPPGLRERMERPEVVDSGVASVDNLLEAAAKAPPEEQNSLWTQAAMHALGEGDPDRARKIIERCSDSNVRDEVLARIDEQALQRATEAGRLDEARQLLSQASIEERVSVLTQFAQRASTQGDKKAALQMLEEARDLVGTQASNGAELNALLGVARAYAALEPARSFDIVEPVVDHLNRLLAAAVIVDGFEFTGYFRDGELMQRQSPLISLVLQFADDTAILARADFERARAVADKFQSTDVRLKARLAVAQGILLDNLPTRVSSNTGRFYSKPMVVFHDGHQIIFQRSQ